MEIIIFIKLTTTINLELLHAGLLCVIYIKIMFSHCDVYVWGL